jgi:hypothetical protein
LQGATVLANGLREMRHSSQEERRQSEAGGGFGMAAFVLGLVACGGFLGSGLALVAEGIIGEVSGYGGVTYLLASAQSYLFWGGFLVCFPGFFLAGC